MKCTDYILVCLSFLLAGAAAAMAGLKKLFQKKQA